MQWSRPALTSRLKLSSAAMLRPRWIMERDIVEANGALHPRRQLERVLRRADDRPRLQQFAQALHGAGGALHLAPHFGERGGRAADERGVEQKLRRAARRSWCRRCTWRAPSHNTKVMPPNTSMTPMAVSAARTLVRRTAVAKLSSTAFAIAFALQLLHGESLHGLDRVQRLVRQTAGVGDAILRRARQAAHSPAGDE